MNELELIGHNYQFIEIARRTKEITDKVLTTSFVGLRLTNNSSMVFRFS
jgi:hypothetical protein